MTMMIMGKGKVEGDKKKNYETNYICIAIGVINCYKKGEFLLFLDGLVLNSMACRLPLVWTEPHNRKAIQYC